VKLDVTSDKDVVTAARICHDVTVVVNNAGIARPGGLLQPEAVEAARAQLDTNVFGILRITQTFAPVLAQNGGGAFLNVLSAASWINSGAMTAYAVSKAAAWSLTNGLRNELRHQGTQVLSLHVGFVDTDLTRGLDVIKVSPQSVVAVAIDALEAGASEVLADERTRTVKRGLTTDPPIYL
jgi:short-subunit dehydrogenase